MIGCCCKYESFASGRYNFGGFASGRKSGSMNFDSTKIVEDICLFVFYIYVVSIARDETYTNNGCLIIADAFQSDL